MKTYQVNFDYEARLYNEDYLAEKARYARLNSEMEYIYFFTEKSITKLKNQSSYSKDYLDYLKSMGCIIPEFTLEAENVENWW